MQVPHHTLTNGVRIPMIGLGTWQLEGETCVRAVKQALELGYIHIDTAVMYGNHREIGRAIKEYPREKLFITTKIWHGDLHYENVLMSCEQSLEELGVEYIDLVLVHWPNKSTPMQETFSALKKLHEEKKIRAIGVSNFTIAHLEEALQVSEVPITVNQVEFHPFLYQQELLLFCLKNDIHLEAYSPLARGKVNEHPLLLEIAKKHGKTPGQIALRWLLEKRITVIPKASSKKHLEENIALDFKLSKEDIALLDNLPQQRIINPGFAEF